MLDYLALKVFKMSADNPIEQLRENKEGYIIITREDLYMYLFKLLACACMLKAINLLYTYFFRNIYQSKYYAGLSVKD